MVKVIASWSEDWSRGPGLKFQGSHARLRLPIVGKMSTGWSKNPGLSFIYIHLEGGGEVYPTMAYKINLNNLTFCLHAILPTTISHPRLLATVSVCHRGEQTYWTMANYFHYTNAISRQEPDIAGVKNLLTLNLQDCCTRETRVSTCNNPASATWRFEHWQK